MSEIDPNELERVFNLALDALPDERSSILDRECRGHAALRAKAEALLANADDEKFLNAPTAHFYESSRGDSGEQPGTRIGSYKLLQVIGEGGFGTVFMAEQEKPVSRKVALKIIKLGMDTRQVVARFEQERQALALMDHPNVARVYDAGATEAGRPYFVMELCTGQPITEYCDKNSLNIPQRLELFAQVCRAVQHAHQKGLIHRDIKPSNVLVSTQDGKPHAKIIDFGIAKATQSRLTEKTLFTEHRALIGTPQYMSPEQAEGSLDIDTRSDVYSLGVLLYELLTGVTPFDGRTLRSAAYDEMQRIIREVDPPKPSTRISQSTDTIAGVAARRNTEPRRLGTLVRGELDWLVMKALEKDRSRRYESATALAADVERFLAGEAVIAAPLSRVYRARKFLRRNKGPVSAVGAVIVALSLGAVAFAWQARVARSDRDRAVWAEAQTAQRAAELQKVSDFQSRMLEKVDASSAGLRLTADVRSRYSAALEKASSPEGDRLAQVAVFESAWSRINATDAALELIKSTILAPALAETDRQFADQPKLNATLKNAIGRRFLDLGLYDDALGVFRQVSELRTGALGDGDPDTLSAIIARCKTLIFLGKAGESEAILRPLIERERPRLGAEHQVILLAVECLGEALLRQNRRAEAVELFQQSLAARRRTLGDDHEDTLQSIGNLAMTLRGDAKYAEAEALARETLDRRRRIYGAKHNFTLHSYNNLAVIQLDQGRFQEAVENFQTATEGRRLLLGEAHRETLVTASNLAAALGRLQKHAEAESIQRDLLEKTRRILGADHPDSLMMLSNLASTLITMGKLDEAEPLTRESLERRLRVFGPSSAEAVTANNVMAFLLRRQKKDAEAEPHLRAALEASRIAWGLDHPETLVLLLNLGPLANDRGRPVEGEQLLREALERSTRTLGSRHPYSLMAVQRLSEVLFSQKRYTECAQLLGESEPNFRAAAAARDGGELRALLLGLGKSRVELGEFPSAEASLTEAHALNIAARGPEARGTQLCVQALVQLYTSWHAAAPAGGYDAKAAEWRTRLVSPSSQPATVPSSQSATRPG